MSAERVVDLVSNALKVGIISPDVSASGYGEEFVRWEGGDIVKLDGDFNLRALATRVVSALLTEMASDSDGAR